MVQANDFREQPCAATATCDPSLARSIQDKGTVAWISLSAGIVLLGTATWVLLAR